MFSILALALLFTGCSPSALAREEEVLLREAYYTYAGPSDGDHLDAVRILQKLRRQGINVVEAWYSPGTPQCGHLRISAPPVLIIRLELYRGTVSGLWLARESDGPPSPVRCGVEVQHFEFE